MSRLLGLVLVISCVVSALDRAHATIAACWLLAAGIAFVVAWRAERRAASHLARAVDNLANAIVALAALDADQRITAHA